MMEISSEIYKELDICSKGDNNIGQFTITNFQYQNPDKDNELEETIKISIGLRISTNLDLVGYQVWRGSLLLSDFLIHNRHHFDVIGDKVLELGSGCGLAAIVGAINNRKITCSDIQSVLGIINENVRRNMTLIRPEIRDNIKVLKMDFLQPLTPHLFDILDDIDTIIAADIIYDNKITEGLINNILRPIFDRKPSMKLYMALEKRYVFTIDDCDTIAPCYEHFRNMILDIDHVSFKSMPITFPQYFSYKRVKDLLLLEIKIVQ